MPRRQVARQPRLGAVRHVQQDQPVAVPLPVERRRDRERAVADGGAVDGDADGHALVHRYLNVAFWRRRDLLRVEGVQAALQAYGTGSIKAVFQAWALVVLAAWIEAHE